MLICLTAVRATAWTGSAWGLCRRLSTDAHATSSPWRERATTLFARRPEQLLQALDATLQDWRECVSPDAETIFLYALGKNLPREALADAVGRLRQVSGPACTRFGVLSTPLPPSLLRQDTTDAHDPGYSLAMAAIPKSRARAFRSTIPGAPRIAVGRWPEQKDVWKLGTTHRVDQLDTVGGDWRQLWGRENVAGRIPKELQHTVPTESILMISDPRPQGLLEGLETHFPASRFTGIVAPYTPFETGRDHTFLLDGLEGEPNAIHDKGALGIAFYGSEMPSSISRVYEGVEPLGHVMEITSALGNIVSTLDGKNAAQQLLRLVAPKQAAREQNMTREQVRELSSHVKKEDEFLVGIFVDNALKANDPVHAHAEPTLLARVSAGHPMRGTIGIETDVELQPAGPARYLLQFFRRKTDSTSSLVPLAAAKVPDGCVRYVFLTVPGAGAHVAPDPAAENARTMDCGAVQIADAFMAASEQGWLARSPSDRAHALMNRTQTCTVPLSRAIFVRYP